MEIALASELPALPPSITSLSGLSLLRQSLTSLVVNLSTTKLIMAVQVWEILTACENARVGRPCGLDDHGLRHPRQHGEHGPLATPCSRILSMRHTTFQTIMAFCDRGRFIDYNFFIFQKDLIACGVTMIQDNLGIKDNAGGCTNIIRCLFSECFPMSSEDIKDYFESTSPRSSLVVVRTVQERGDEGRGDAWEPAEFFMVDGCDTHVVAENLQIEDHLHAGTSAAVSLQHHRPPDRVKPLELDLSKTASQSHHTTHGGLATSVGPRHARHMTPRHGSVSNYQQTEKSLALSFNNAPHREAFPKPNCPMMPMPQAPFFNAVPRLTDSYHAAPATVVRCKQSHLQTGDNHRPPPRLQHHKPKQVSRDDTPKREATPKGAAIAHLEFGRASSKMMPPAGKTTT
ncbi:hypothetical protein HU200_041891 [Digitaria exilis]|uniref:Uncharacterized protein n=1 Tax=Digitaria exilis TaxID=1010633 RepID=A0A835EGA4_9POAL|nr:hypothetical protein HU200_041891 [Digitaria exilis]